MAQLSIEQAIQLAVTHHQAGRLGEAEVLYRQILSAVPNHPNALHLLGLIAGQVGKVDDAVGLIGKAIAAAPNNPTFYFDRGIFLERQGKPDQAIESYQARSIATAIISKPKSISATSFGNRDKPTAPWPVMNMR